MANTKSCEAPHLQYHVSGRLRIRMDDGAEAEYGPGDVALVPPGHDAWVIGNEPVVILDISGMVDYAKKK
jgi:quercetin dioxygenase-like cupin family protein